MKECSWISHLPGFFEVNPGICHIPLGCQSFGLFQGRGDLLEGIANPGMELFFAKGSAGNVAYMTYRVQTTIFPGDPQSIALSIDGLNSIDAKTTTAYKASKWVLDPWASITMCERNLSQPPL